MTQGLMERYVLGILVPMVLSAVLLFLAEGVPTWLSKKTGARRRGLLPAPNGAYVLAALFAGALSAYSFMLLSRKNAIAGSLIGGGFILAFFSVMHLLQSMKIDDQARAEKSRTLTVLVVPFVAGAWLSAVACALLFR